MSLADTINRRIKTIQSWESNLDYCVSDVCSAEKKQPNPYLQENLG